MTATRPRPPESRREAEKRGRFAEQQAAWLLRLKGYRILEQRFRTPSGEIDIVVRRGRTVAFVEVKRRASFEAAAESITPAGRTRITDAARAWLARRPEFADHDLRFDAVLCVPRRLPHHMRNAFDAAARP